MIGLIRMQKKATVPLSFILTSGSYEFQTLVLAHCHHGLT
jgi:hypothetical protein